MSNIVSVIIPLYNREELIVETLQSLLNQTFNNWEAIVVDDGSTDNSYNVVDEISKKEPRIKLLKRNREPKGAPTCRNIGIKESSGNFIMFLDSDDLLSIKCLEERTKTYLKHKDSDFLVFQSILFQQKIDDLNIIPNIFNKETKDLDRFLNFDYTWNISSVLIKKEFLISKTIKFEEGLACHQDLEFAIKLIINTKSYKKFDEIQDVYIRMGGGDKLSNKQTEKKHLEGKIDFIKTIATSLSQSDRLDTYYKDKIFKLSVYYSTFFFKEKYYSGIISLLKVLKKEKIISMYLLTLCKVYLYCIQHTRRKYNLPERLINKIFQILRVKITYKNVPPINCTLAKFHINDLKLKKVKKR